MAIQDPEASEKATTQGLILPSLEVKNFRAFRHLLIEKLGRVNLITGKNNVGKSSLLEALWLYTERGALRVVRQLLTERAEMTEQEGQFVSTASPFDPASGVSSLRTLFHGRPMLRQATEPLVIGPMDTSGTTLSWGIAWSEEGSKNLDVQILLVNATGRTLSTSELNERSFKSTWMIDSDTQCLFLTSRRHDEARTGRLWDNIALTVLEEEVVAALRLLKPELERIGLRYEPGGTQGRVPFVKIGDFREPVPLATLGGGMNRLFDTALALVNSRNGTLLIDEIENGLHYSVLPDVWRLVFQTARRLNVQVFATTHSWDCIEAFQEAAAESPEDGALIKLRQNTSGNVEAIVFDEEDLEVITRDQIEVR